MSSHVEQVNVHDLYLFVTLCISGGDSHQEGLACYRLGNAYEGISEHETAIQVRAMLLGIMSPFLVSCPLSNNQSKVILHDASCLHACQFWYRQSFFLFFPSVTF